MDDHLTFAGFNGLLYIIFRSQITLVEVNFTLVESKVLGEVLWDRTNVENVNGRVWTMVVELLHEV